MSDENNDGDQPAPEGFDSWNAFWTSVGMPWRRQPEIAAKRQAYLTARRAVRSDIRQGIYPFRDANGGIKLTRADVEWLLATHHDGQWPAAWGRTTPGLQRQGIDLRGADLRGVDLQRLPLMQVRAGLDAEEWGACSSAQRDASALHLENANLHYAFLQDAALRGAHMEGSNLESAHLEGAMLRGAWLGGIAAPAGLHGARRGSQAGTTTLRFAHLDAGSNVPDIRLGDKVRGFVRLADIHWNGADITRVPWSHLSVTGDEQHARTATANGKRKSRQRRIDDYRTAARGYLQLVVALRSQGMNDDADRYAYRAQLMQRAVLLRQAKLGQWFFSWLLWTLAGYGYRLQRILITYALILTAFALVYYLVGLPNEHATTLLQQIADAYQVSLTAIHGRTFFEQFGIGSTLAWVAATESVCGLVIEAVFTSMLVQRFFAR